MSVVTRVRLAQKAGGVTGPLVANRHFSGFSGAVGNGCISSLRVLLPFSPEVQVTSHPSVPQTEAPQSGLFRGSQEADWSAMRGPW